MYRIDLEGSRTGQGTLEDPYLRGIYLGDGGDQADNPIADTGNDDGGTELNSRVFYEAGLSGTHYIAAGAYGRDTGTYKLSVTEIPENSDDYAAGTGTTGVVTVGGSARGAINQSGDRDWFAVELVAGKTYRIDLEGSRTGQGTLRDPYLRGIHSVDGGGQADVIAGTSNDDAGTGLNSRVFYEAEVSGTYYIAAGAYEAGSYENTGTYKLSVREFSDDYAGNTGTTGVVTVGGSATGRMDYDGDRDWFAVTLQSDANDDSSGGYQGPGPDPADLLDPADSDEAATTGSTYRIEVKGDSPGDYGGTLHNPAVAVFDSSGNPIRFAADDNSGVGLNARLAAFTPDSPGTYYIQVDDPGGIGTYTVSVEQVYDTPSVEEI